MLEFTLFLMFPAAMAFAGAMDLFTMTIPNRITVGLVIAFVAAAIYAPLGWPQVASHLGAGLLMLGVGIFMFWRNWVGGGDAKLLAAAALWFGFEGLLQYLLLVSICGGVLVLVLLAYRNMTPALWMYRQEWAMRLHKQAGGIPYGIALAAGGLWLYPSTPWLASLAI
ncbi:MAG: prepilin peptidase [Hyphomicrobiaceae bacterium]|nr:prepilin peptidase [Hyphomicrobiaceae bacterium]